MGVLLFVVIINALLGLFVLARNAKSKVNIIFFLLVLNICLWSISSYFTDNAATETARLVFAKLAFLFPALFSALLALFSKIFPVQSKISKKEIAFVATVTLFGVFISLSNLVVAGVNMRTDGTDILPGAMYNFYTVVVLLLLGFAARVYIKNRKHADTIQRLQSRFMAYGLLISFFWALVFSVILPLFVTTWVTAKVGPVGTIFFVGATAYAIVRHKLFDVRLVVARSIAYVLSVLVLGVVYGFIAFNLAALVSIDQDKIPLGQEVFYIALAVAMAFTFPPIRKFFNRITNKMFYRDAYEPQVLIDELNKVLVGNIDLVDLLTKSSTIIGSTLKAEFCVFGIRETQNEGKRIIGTRTRSFSEEDINTVRKLTPKTGMKVIITDELGSDQRELHTLLLDNNIALMARLVDSAKKGNEGLGYLVLGSKKSGNPYSSQDVKILEIIADEMVIAIQNALHFEEIQNFAKTLQDKVDEATRNLRSANEKLKKLDETKDDFISMASHQLRTPLTSVKGYISMVLEGDTGKVNTKQKEMLNQAFISSQRMVYLIADLLNVSRLRTGKFVIEPKPTNLADVIEGEISQLTETAKGRNLTLSYEKPKTFPELMLDETKIRQVVMNFADNAIYYTPAGGHITVNLADLGDRVELTVVDDGMGVPKSEQHHLFNKFYRAGNAKKARPDGTGLGLFMAKKVVVAQGGSIIFKSTEGKGSTFGFSFAKKPLLPQNYKGPHPTTTA